MEKVIDQLEAEANRKGYTGYPEPVFTEGVHVGDRTRYSERLLMFRLKALAPEKYRERRQVEVKDAPVTVVLPDNGRGSRSPEAAYDYPTAKSHRLAVTTCYDSQPPIFRGSGTVGPLVPAFGRDLGDAATSGDPELDGAGVGA